MGYRKIWKVLEALYEEICKRDTSVPVQVLRDLRSAKTLIHVLDSGVDYGEQATRIEEYLESVESYLIPEVSRVLGQEAAEAWLRKIEAARMEPDEEPVEVEASKFVVGVPRDSHWIRVKVYEELPKERIEALAKEADLKIKMEDESHIIVYGEASRVKTFIKKVAEKLRGSE